MPSTQDILKEKTAGGLYILKEGMKGYLFNSLCLFNSFNSLQTTLPTLHPPTKHGARNLEKAKYGAIT
jgi:hypothetical protein